MEAMADLLEDDDPNLREALFVYFAETLIIHYQSGEGPRFVRRGAEWIFEGRPSHPLRVFGERAASIAHQDRTIAALIEATAARIESTAQAVMLDEPVGV